MSDPCSHRNNSYLLNPYSENSTSTSHSMAVVIAFQLDAISKHQCLILNEIGFIGAFSPKLNLFSDTNADKRRTNKSVAADNFTVVQI